MKRYQEFDIVARYQFKANFYTNCTKLSLQLLNLEISIVKIQSINLSSVPEIVIRVIPTHTQRLTSNWGKGNKGREKFHLCFMAEKRAFSFGWKGERAARDP